MRCLEMNKTELVYTTVATQAELLKQDAKKLWKPCLITHLRKKKIRLIGFGTFEVRERAGRNLQTG